MTITIFSNFFNHHQKPLCDELFSILGDNFKFVSTIPIPESFLKNGYEDFSKIEYNHLAYINEKAHEKAMELGANSDFVIIGSAPEKFIKKRLKHNKHTFWYSERVFRKNKFEKFNIKILKRLIFKHFKNHFKNVYLLCNSAFTPNDFNWVFLYPNKKYKWGYFPKIDDLDINHLLKEKNKKTIHLLYVSRLIKLKHPELAVELVKKLNDANYDFKLSIIGKGPLENTLKKTTAAYNLNNKIDFLGNLPNDQVLKYFKKSNIFIFTSDRNEGWGAVANEAMNNGCALVASNTIGAIPYLVTNQENGLVFKSEDSEDLFLKVKSLIDDKKFREEIAENAYYSMKEVWSPKNAANNLIKLCYLKENNQKNNILKGPCSDAKSTKKNWYLNK